MAQEPRGHADHARERPLLPLLSGKTRATLTGQLFVNLDDIALRTSVVPGHRIPFTCMMLASPRSRPGRVLGATMHTRREIDESKKKVRGRFGKNFGGNALRTEDAP